MINFCEFAAFTAGAKCLNGCGYELKRDYPTGYKRECKDPPTTHLTDTLLRDGVESTIQLLRSPCIHMGERTDQRAKAQCGDNSAYLPVYRCEIHRLCSPFQACKDPELIHPCPGCDLYLPTFDTPPAKS